jgi:hypothetical protein
LPGAINRLVPMDEASIDRLTSCINPEIAAERAGIAGTE